MTKVWIPLIIVGLLFSVACSREGLRTDREGAAGVRQDLAADAPELPSRIGESDGVPWEWLTLGGTAALASILPAGLWRGWKRVRQGRYAAWEQGALEAHALTTAVHEALVADFARNPASHGLPEEPTQRWRDAQRYINDVSVDLRALEAKSPDKASASAVRELLAALVALRSAIRADLGGWAQGEPAPDAQPGHSATLVRRRLLDLGDALRSFRPAASPIETDHLIEEEAAGQTAA